MSQLTLRELICTQFLEGKTSYASVEQELKLAFPTIPVHELEQVHSTVLTRLINNVVNASTNSLLRPYLDKQKEVIAKLEKIAENAEMDADSIRAHKAVLEEMRQGIQLHLKAEAHFRKEIAALQKKTPRYNDDTDMIDIEYEVLLDQVTGYERQLSGRS